MPLTGDRVTNEKLESQFPLFQHGEYDFFFPNAQWEIGLKSTYPESLKKKIAAVLVSELMGLKSVDNVLKNYLSDVQYPEEDDARLDLRIRAAVTKLISKFDALIFAISISGEVRGNRVIGLLTLQRSVFSMDFLAFCGQRGALFEGVAIARMMLEQLAWSFSVAKSLDDNAVQKVSATRAISSLKSEIETAGLFYGWLSQHAHWHFDAHKKVVISKEGKLGHLYASSYFKAILFSVMLIMTDLYFQILQAICSKELEELKAEPGASMISVEEVKTVVTAFLSEIAACEPSDVELKKLVRMIKGSQV